MPLPFLGAGAGIAIRGAGKALLKNAVKRAKKTPNKQFKHAVSIDRSDSLRNLAHEEWKSQQLSIYDNNNHRWYLSYASMKNEYTRDLYKYA